VGIHACAHACDHPWHGC